MNTKLLSYVVKTSLFLPFLWDRFWAFFYKKSMGSCGKNVMLKPATSKGIENFYIASDVRIARYAVIYSTVAKVYIGSKVEIAPHLKIITGNHNFQSVGHFMFDGNYSKNKSDDRDVIIEGDSWLGINVTLLSGVTIGRGSCIAAGAVVTKSMPRYSIIGGVPAKVLKFRFTPEQIIEHERKLYPESERMSIEDIMNERNNLKFCNQTRSYFYDQSNNIRYTEQM